MPARTPIDRAMDRVRPPGRSPPRGPAGPSRTPCRAARGTALSLLAWLLACPWSGSAFPALRAQEAATGEAAYHRRLLRYRAGDGSERPVRTAEDWARRRLEIVHGMERALGALPDRSRRIPLATEVHGRRPGEGFERLHVSFRAEVGHRVPAYVYLPRAGDGSPLRGPHAAVLALHPTSPLGKDVVAGRSRRPGRGYALELARRGYVVMAPDYPSFGELEGYDFATDRHPSGSMQGLWNHVRCVDWLSARDDVDPGRIGVIGHSLGGHNAMFAAVFDERLRCIVSSCGWTPFADYYGGDIRGWTSARYMPRLDGVWDLDPDRVPFEFHEVVGALAPRTFVSCSPERDGNFAVEGVRKAVAEARKVYALHGASERLVLHTPDAGHAFPETTRLAAYRTLDKVLDHGPRRPRAHRGQDAPGRGEGLRAGVAVVDIGPPEGGRLSGYFRERRATGTLDPLRARALCLLQGDTAVEIVLCDLIGIAPGVARAVRARTAERTGIPAAHITVAATHTHTGPLYFGPLRDLFRKRAEREHGHDPLEPDAWRERLVERLVDVAVRARDLARPAELATAKGRAPGLAFNRRFHMRDGSVRFNPGKGNPGIVEPAGPVDPEVDVLLLRPEGRDGPPRAALTVFALHLDTVGGTRWSADFPRFLGATLRERFGPAFVSLFGTGCCGDVNHIDVDSGAPQKGPDEARRIGEELASAVLEAVEGAETHTPRLGVRRTFVEWPMHEVGEDELARAREDVERIGSGDIGFLDAVRAYRAVDIAKRGGGKLRLEVQAVRLAEDVALVALPGEIFVELGLEIERRSPFRTTMVVELANDAPGYIPTRKAFREGSYETVNSRVRPGAGEALVDAALRLLDELDLEDAPSGTDGPGSGGTHDRHREERP